MLTTGIVLVIGSIVTGIITAIVIFIKNSNDDDFQRSGRRTERGLVVGIVCVSLFFIGIALIGVYTFYSELMKRSHWLPISRQSFLYKTGSNVVYNLGSYLEK